MVHGHVGQVQLGEYLGRPEELPVAAMHAYIDAERYAGLSIDEALRALLQGFRLPGARCSRLLMFAIALQCDGC